MVVFKEWFKIKDEKKLEFSSHSAFHFMDERHIHKFQIISIGGLSSIISKTILAPIERLKIELQTCRIPLVNTPSQIYIKNNLKNQLKNNNLKNITNNLYPNVISLYENEGFIGWLKYTKNMEGFSALFRGNGANVIRVIPTSIIKFGFFDIYKQFSYNIFYNTNYKYKDFLMLFTSASLSGLTLTILTYPFDIIRTRLTVIPYYSKYNVLNSKFILSPYFLTSIRCARELIKHEGYFSLWKGVETSMVGVFSYVTCTFTSYELLKSFFYKMIEIYYGFIVERDSKVDLMIHFTCGVISTFIGKTVSYPADTVRRRRQLVGCVLPVHYNPFYLERDLQQQQQRENGNHNNYGNYKNGHKFSPHLEVEEEYHYTQQGEDQKKRVQQQLKNDNSNANNANNTINKSKATITTTTTKLVEMNNNNNPYNNNLPLFTGEDGKPLYKNTPDAIKKIIKEEGMSALFRGWRLNVLKVLPSQAIQFVIYEQCKKYLNINIRDE
ncbi:hypothetical protein ABK040_000696 [Willaertia magna]